MEDFDKLNSSDKQCLHCHNPLLHQQSFCCQGCEAAYKICSLNNIHNATNIQDIFSHFTKQDAHNHYHLTLNIENIHCIGCVQHIQQTLLKEPNIISVRVTVSTKRIYLVWHGNTKQADYFAHLIRNMGYVISTQPVSDNPHSANVYEKSLLYGLIVSGFGIVAMIMLSLGMWSLEHHNQNHVNYRILSILSLLIALPVVIYAAKPFFQSAWTALKNKHTNIDIPISIGIILSIFISLYDICVTHNEQTYFITVILLIFCLLTGRYLDNSAKNKARHTASILLSKVYDTANLVQDNDIITISNQDLITDMILHIPIGETIPADGKIISGKTTIDTHLITGDKTLITTDIGTHIFAGSLNITDTIQMRVTTSPKNSILSKIIKSLENAEHTQSYFVLLAHKIIGFYVPVILLLSIFSFGFWFIFCGFIWQKSLMIAISLLMISCPCALAIGVPVVYVIAIRRLLKKGILIQSNSILEQLKTVTHIIIDDRKTDYANQKADINILESKGLNILLLSQKPLSFNIVQHIESLKKLGYTTLFLSDNLIPLEIMTSTQCVMSMTLQACSLNSQAHIICFNNNLASLVEIYNTGITSQILVKQNFIFAILYNLIAIPLAFLGLITPVIAAILMSFSSLTIIAKSFRVLYRRKSQ